MKTLKEVMENRNNENSAEILQKIFSQRLRELRIANGMSQADVAKKLDIPISTYANWEQGRREPDIYGIFSLIWALDIEANELFDVSGLN